VATLRRASLVGAFFSNSMFSVLHFGNSRNIANVFIVIVSVMVIRDQ
jgi:hypothetical protein